MAVVRATSLQKTSAGILLFRRSGKHVEVLLGHPGGPFWKKKDHGAWTIPKGLIAAGEAPFDAAKREFEEETGHRPGGHFIALGHAKQPGGKTVHVWAAEDDWNPEELKSNIFKMEWPPRSGKYQNFPELDRASWFETEAARERILKGQTAFLDRLRDVLSA
ncbi:putative NUDIX family NTP pyrophosphohydrolase [Bradyrhizobium japonicum]